MAGVVTGGEEGLGVIDGLGDSEGSGSGVGTTTLGAGDGIVGTIRSTDEALVSVEPPTTIAAITAAANPVDAERTIRRRRRALLMTRS